MNDEKIKAMKISKKYFLIMGRYKNMVMVDINILKIILNL